MSLFGGSRNWTSQSRRRADGAVAAEAEPIAVAQLEIVVSEELRDPFADILALSPEERIALFT